MAGIQFDIATSPCPGGGHFEVTATAGALSFSRIYHVNELLTEPTNEELKTLSDLLIRSLIARLNTGDHAECRDRIHGLEITIQPRDAS